MPPQVQLAGDPGGEPQQQGVDDQQAQVISSSGAEAN